MISEFQGVVCISRSRSGITRVDSYRGRVEIAGIRDALVAAKQETRYVRHSQCGRSVMTELAGSMRLIGCLICGCDNGRPDMESVSYIRSEEQLECVRGSHNRGRFFVVKSRWNRGELAFHTPKSVCQEIEVQLSRGAIKNIPETVILLAAPEHPDPDRKSTRLNSSHVSES